MMGRRVIRLAAVLLLLAGMVMLCYPAVGQLVHGWKTTTAVQRFDARLKGVKQQSGDDLEALYQAMVMYNQELFHSGQAELIDPFSYEQVGFSLTEFGFEEEMIGYLTVPKLDLLLPVYLGASAENMGKGAAHLSQTSLPVGGADTNSVICAHRGMRTAVMFRDLHLLEVGDEVLLTNYREPLRYRVAEIAVIEPYQIDKVLIQPGRDMITLLTCHPYGYNTQRYVVYCERAEEQTLSGSVDPGSVSLCEVSVS